MIAITSLLFKQDGTKMLLIVGTQILILSNCWNSVKAQAIALAEFGNSSCGSKQSLRMFRQFMGADYLTKPNESSAVLSSYEDITYKCQRMIFYFFIEVLRPRNIQ